MEELLPFFLGVVEEIQVKKNYYQNNCITINSYSKFYNICLSSEICLSTLRQQNKIGEDVNERKISC